MRLAPFSRLGLLVATATAVADQASKLWLIFVFDLRARMPVHVTPFLDLVMVWNKGISYGLFPQDGPFGQWVLFGLKVAAIALLLLWLTRAGTQMTALSIGLIVGGAVGNAVDRLLHEGVADFILFHITTESFRFHWYVFNLADTAIVAGVAGLLYDSLWGEHAAKAP